jgi:hypothetical protein
MIFQKCASDINEIENYVEKTKRVSNELKARNDTLLMSSVENDFQVGVEKMWFNVKLISFIIKCE